MMKDEGGRRKEEEGYEARKRKRTEDRGRGSGSEQRKRIHRGPYIIVVLC